MHTSRGMSSRNKFTNTKWATKAQALVKNIGWANQNIGGAKGGKK